MYHRGTHMKRRGFLFAVISILIVSLVPLGGVSAQRTAASSSASRSLAPAPAARVLYSKTIKTKVTAYIYGYRQFKYVQKIYWAYNNKTIRYWEATMKGVVYNPDWSYLGFSIKASYGGVGYPSYYRWTRGHFREPTLGNFYIHIEQEVYYDGTYWTNWWTSG
jgi:hypothetical protein